MDVYVDDMLVKSSETFGLLSDLEEIFSILRKSKMRLNLTKYALRVPSSKFMGYMVNNRGIETNYDKIRAILHMVPPNTVKDV